MALFAREVTILIQVIAGLVYFGLAGYETLRAHRTQSKSGRESRHLYYFGMGCIIFGVALVLGAVTKQWWLYYLAAVPSAFYIGLGVREDMLYTRLRVERATPFLRDELFHALNSGSVHETKVRDLQDLLGKRLSPTLVMVISPTEPEKPGDDWLTARELTRTQLAEQLDETVGQADYLLLPMGAGHFTVCLDTDEPQARQLAETLQSARGQGQPQPAFAIGIGQWHPTRELQHSYLEAQTALQAARRSKKSPISYIDLGSLSLQRVFPTEARDEFLLEFKHGHGDSARRRLNILLDQLELYVEGDAMAYRVQLLQLLSILLEQITPHQSPAPALLTEAASAFENLVRLERTSELTERFTATIDQLLDHVAPPQVEATTGNNPLQRAKAFIQENLAEEIKVGDVARQAGVSTSQLQRVFRDRLGMTFNAYLTTIRITRAKELLAGTDLSITDIAYDVGYNDSNYFSTAFRKHEGLSPRKYRNQEVESPSVL